MNAQGDQLDCTVSGDEPGVQRDLCVCMRDVGVHSLGCGLVRQSAHFSRHQACPQHCWRETVAIPWNMSQRGGKDTHTRARATRRHAHAHAHEERHMARVHAHAHAHTHTHTHADTHKHMCTRTNTHVQVHVNTFTCVPTHDTHVHVHAEGHVQ